MNQDPLRTPSESADGDELLRELQASMRNGGLNGFGSMPNALPAMNAGPTFGWSNIPIPPTQHPERVSMPPDAVPTNMVAQVTKLIPTIKVNDNDIWNCNPDELYDMLFRWTLSLSRYDLHFAALMARRQFRQVFITTCADPVQKDKMKKESQFLFHFLIERISFKTERGKALHSEPCASAPSRCCCASKGNCCAP